LLSLLPLIRPLPTSTLFPYTTLFRSHLAQQIDQLLASQRQVDEKATLRTAVVGPDGRFQKRATGDAETHHGHAEAGTVDHLHHRSEEHTSELQSRRDLVCRLLLEKKK